MSRSKLANIFRFKCPKCRQGDLFETSAWSFRKPFDMPEHCPSCGQSYAPEPGFYYGAMFIGYILTGWLFLGLAGVGILVFGLTPTEAILIVLAVGALFFIYFFRLARSIWIHLMVSYDPGAIRGK